MNKFRRLLDKKVCKKLTASFLAIDNCNFLNYERACAFHGTSKTHFACIGTAGYKRKGTEILVKCLNLLSVVSLPDTKFSSTTICDTMADPWTCLNVIRM